MQHHFDIDIAAEYGINAAIILENLHFWIVKNEANEANFHDGKCWTYNSVKAFETLFPYMSSSTISRALKKLEDEGLIITGNYNKSAYDRTKWYALTEKGKALFKSTNSISQNDKMDSSKSENGIDDLTEPIPDIKPDAKPNRNKDIGEKRKRFTAPTLEEVSEYCKERNNSVDPQRWFDYYSANGWMVGRNKMKDWKAAVRTWERNSFDSKPKQAYKPNDESDWDF